MIPVKTLNTLHYFLFIFDTDALIRYGGLFMLCLLVYGSTGLFFCFIVPSGAVLFAAGIYAATGQLQYPVTVICLLLTVSSVLGNLTGYWFGKKAGPSLYRRKDSGFFRRQYLVKTEEFYKKYGKIALAASFFLPIVRTFSPIIAGIVRMNFRRFIVSSLVGSALWIMGFVLAGYFIGKQPLLKPWLKYIVTGFVLIITVPLIVKIVREFRRSGKGKA